jgi:hypothetical protein
MQENDYNLIDVAWNNIHFHKNHSKPFLILISLNVVQEHSIYLMVYKSYIVFYFCKNILNVKLMNFMSLMFFSNNRK